MARTLFSCCISVRMKTCKRWAAREPVWRKQRAIERDLAARFTFSRQHYNNGTQTVNSRSFCCRKYDFKRFFNDCKVLTSRVNPLFNDRSLRNISSGSNQGQNRYLVNRHRYSSFCSSVEMLSAETAPSTTVRTCAETGPARTSVFNTCDCCCNTFSVAEANGSGALFSIVE